MLTAADHAMLLLFAVFIVSSYALSYRWQRPTPPPADAGATADPTPTGDVQ